MKKISLLLICLTAISGESTPILKLGGTVVAGKGGSRAIIELGDGKTTEVCEAGKVCSAGNCSCEVAGYRVLRIQPQKVILQRGAEKFTLTLDGIRGKYAQTYIHDFPRASIHKTIDRRGLKARDVLQDLFKDLDLRSTDTLKTVQGLPVPDQVKWGTVYGGINAANEIIIEIERDGRLVVFKLRVTGP